MTRLVCRYYKRCSGDPRESIEVMGYAVRTPNYRYVEWFSYNTTALQPLFNDTVAVELYNHTGDDGRDMGDSE